MKIESYLNKHDQCHQLLLACKTKYFVKNKNKQTNKNKETNKNKVKST